MWRIIRWLVSDVEGSVAELQQKVVLALGGMTASTEAH